MSANDILANVLSKMNNAEHRSKPEVEVSPVSKSVKAVLNVLRDNQYIGELKETKGAAGVTISVTLIGKINKCGAVKPRHFVKLSDIERFEKRLLPAKDFGILIISTSQGIMTHLDAKSKGIGGKLIAYCY